MEEKKKRWRPSLTAYRELEKKLAEQIEGTSQLVKDCDAWREKYRELKKKYDDALHVRNDVVPRKVHQELVTENRTLVESNKLMEEELNRVRDANVSLGKKCAELNNKLSELLSRGWFARLLNKK